MMKLSVKQIVFLILLVIVFAISLFVRYPIKLNSSFTELLPLSVDKEISNAIQDKFSSSVNVLIEGKDFDVIKKDADSFYENLLKEDFKNITYKMPCDLLDRGLEYVKKYRHVFLLKEDREDIINNNTQSIVNKSVEFISTTFSPLAFDASLDPFSLLNRYMSRFLIPTKWQERDGVLWQELDGNRYVMMNISVDAKNIDNLNLQVNKIKEIYNKLNLKSKFYFQGVPLHTLSMYNKSKFEISLLSMCSIVFLIILTKTLFSDYRALFVVALNLSVGFLVALLGLIIFFDEIHILSFVFGSSLIGICIDYTFHKMFSSNTGSEKEVKRALFQSFLTTIFCFTPLLFLSIPLLKQVAVFTIFGLFGTFFYVVCLSKNVFKATSVKFYVMPFNKKTKAIITTLFLSFIVVGTYNISIKNDLTSFYVADKKLEKADKLFYSLNDASKSRFLVIKGESLQDVLETEEKIRENINNNINNKNNNINIDAKDKNNFFGLASIFPSLKRQKENFRLIEKLYDREKENIRNELGLKNKLELEKEANFILKDDFLKSFSELYNRFIIEDKEILEVIPVSFEIKNLPKNAVLFSPTFMLQEALNKCAKETYISLFYSMIVLACMIFLFYGKRAFLYLLPSMVSIFSLASFFNIMLGYITFFHLMSFFIILGLSIDCTIFHLSIKKNQNLKSILYAFLSSFVGFGLLSFASFRIISIMGMTIALGLMISYLFSLFIIRNE
ncbi:MAG: hypothetical protein ACOX3T_02340 [Bdellovibrionota bacterium]